MSAFQTLLYYKYCKIDEPEVFAHQHLKFCKSLDLTGRILVAAEGINGTVSGTPEACKSYMEHLGSNPVFEGIEFKIDEESEPSFSKMHVRAREEIVTLGLESDVDPTQKTAPHVDAETFQEMMEDENVVVVDVRNNIEHEVGKFKDAVTMDLEHFRDFPKGVEELETYKEKTILAYCTGGIRCEKATAYLLQKGFENVYQLDGGIIKYSKETGGKDFQGKCYVFDKRLAVDVNSVNPEIITQCRICEASTEKLINCANLNATRISLFVKDVPRIWRGVVQQIVKPALISVNTPGTATI